MLDIVYTLLIVSLLFVLYNDIKSRTVHVFLLALLFSLALLINHFSRELNVYDMLYNMGFVILNIVGLTVYFSLKTQSYTNPIDTSIGLGDIVFFMAITPLFNLKTYVLFFIIGLIFSLLTHGIILLFKKVKNIPLAGYLALFLAINVLAKNVFRINLPF